MKGVASRCERPAGDPCIDPAVLHEISGGDARFERELVRRFAEASAEDAAGLAMAAVHGDCALAVQAAHRAKGSSRTLGAYPLAAVCERIERAAKGGDVPTVARLVPVFAAELERVLQFLSELKLHADR